MTEPRLVIAGTGRAGTTFLVQFLAACGVPAGDLDDLNYFSTPRAGLEQNVLSSDSYLVKDTMLFEYIHRIDLEATPIDAVILPVRKLRHAAASRIRQERAQQVARGLGHDRTVFADAPGGAIYAISIQDQERVLAVGQARLIEWCLANSVPLVLVHYPRLIHDGTYLVDALSSVLAPHCPVARATKIFDELADPVDWLPDILADDGDPEAAEQAVQLEATRLAIESLLHERLESDVRLEASRQALTDVEERARRSEGAIGVLERQLATMHGDLEARVLELGGLHHEVAALRAERAAVNEQVAESQATSTTQWWRFVPGARSLHQLVARRQSSRPDASSIK